MPRPRATHACRFCRDRKTRCLPGATLATCLACEKHGVPCVPHVPIQKGSHSRRLISLLSNEVQQLQTALSASGASVLQPPPSCIYDHNFCGLDNITPACIGKVQEDFVEDAIDLMTDTNIVKEKLHLFNKMAVEHPFALCISADCIEDPLVTETAFAISCLAVSTGSQNTPIIRHAEMRFRQILAEEAIINGKQSQDLLQGLLTYMTWYHHCFDPETQQLYQFLQLAKAMADDLGLFDYFTKSEPRSLTKIEKLDYARIVAGLFSLECIISVVGYRKYRRLLDYSSAEMAAKFIVANGQRAADAHALDLTSLLQQNVLVTRGLESHLDNVMLNPDSHTSPQHGRALDACVQFTAGYLSLSLHCAKSPERLPSNQMLPLYFENFGKILAVMSAAPASYLENMTLVEWAFFLTSLVLLPHLELHSNTRQADQCLMRLNELTANLDKFWPSPASRPSHIHWLYLIIKDSSQISLGLIEPKPIWSLLHASPHDLLEELTERQLLQLGSSYTQKKKLRSISTVPPTHNENEVWSEIMVDWLDLG